MINTVWLKRKEHEVAMSQFWRMEENDFWLDYWYVIQAKSNNAPSLSALEHDIDMILPKRIRTSLWFAFSVYRPELSIYIVQVYISSIVVSIL